jgi:hypothetical protein
MLDFNQYLFALKRYSGNKYLLLIKTNKLIAKKTFKRKIKTKGELNLVVIFVTET